MFTGIIEELGSVIAWEPSATAARLTVRAPLAVSDAVHGDSISVSGVCLTVVGQGADWFAADWYARSPVDAPSGPEAGAARVMRGGSFLCHDSYCNRYRNAARSANTPDSSTSNLGFRTVGR